MNGLLVDFEGVLSTNVFASFRAFCTDEGIDPDRIKALFRSNRPRWPVGAKRVGVAPDGCVFVDDLRENCEGAEAVGMTAVLHRGAESTMPQLEELVGVALRSPEAS
jgi:hypothetical protein